MPQRTMRAVGVVVPTPTFNEHLRLVQRIKQFSVQQLIPKLSVKGFDIAILPETTPLNEQGRHGDSHLIQGFKYVGVQCFRPIGPVIAFDEAF